MDSRLYKINIKCPICEKTIEMLKVKISKLKVIKTDTDFFVNYKDIQPIFYEVFVCPNCGYAEFQDRFLSVNDTEKKLIDINITNMWAKKNYSIERDVEKALETYIILYINLTSKNAPDIIIAKALIRIAWIYRMKKDPREKDCLICATESYINAYTKGKFPVGKMDECTCLYIIGELFRRTEQYNKSLKWFSHVINLPNSKKQPHIIRLLMDQMILLKEEIEKTDNKDKKDKTN